MAEYGNSLACVRYRYDPGACTRVKTVEIIVEKNILDTAAIANPRQYACPCPDRLY